MKIILLTGSEARHEFFRKNIAKNESIKVISSYCEDSLENINDKGSILEIQHFEARTQSEIDFFGQSNQYIVDKSNPIFISKGDINNKSIIRDILEKQPDLLVCFGCSLINSELLDIYRNHFLNVHLGISPYYRGSGTNVWPLINNRPDMVGATFMYLDDGIDTGNIIHQIRAKIFLGDSPHSIGNRLIRDMVTCYAQIIEKFDQLNKMKQPNEKGKLFKMKDFDEAACRKLYTNFSSNMIENFINSSEDLTKIIENPSLL